jgi:hypothetical protein
MHRRVGAHSAVSGFVYRQTKLMLHWLSHVSSVCDDWCLHFWEVVGVCFTGLATFAAVVVSLALARLEQVRIAISAGQFDVIGPGSVRPFPEILNIRIAKRIRTSDPRITNS